MSQFSTAREREAYKLGVQAAETAATWIIDGNTKREFIPAVLALMDEGDPRADQYLPRRPDLSGEYADDPTPQSLAREVLGVQSLRHTDASNEEIDAIASAYEQGVSDAFEPACERILKAAMS